MVGRRVLAAAVGAWLSVFIAAPALAAGPRAGGASAAAVQAKVSPLAVVPSSVFAQLNAVTKALNLSNVDGSLGDASLALDLTTVNGSLGDANVYHSSDAKSEPVVVNVKAVATALGILQQELQNLGVSSTLPQLQQAITNLQATLESQPALGQYIKDVDQLAQNGSLELQAAEAHYPAGPLSQSFNVTDAAGAGSLPVVQSLSLAPYTAIASDGDATAKHTVAADSSLDSLSVLPAAPIALNLNGSVLAQLDSLINTIEAALAPAASTAGVTLPAASSITAPVSSTLASTLSTLQGTVGTVSSSVNTVIPAGTPVSDLTGLLTSLLDLKSALTALPSTIDLSDIVQTKDVASHVTTTVTNGVVDSIATTTAADLKVLTIHSPELVRSLGVSEGTALAEVTAAKAYAEATADGRTSKAQGYGQFGSITLLPGSLHPVTVSFSDLAKQAGCTGPGSTCTITAGPLALQILSGACACVDQANGGTADAASAQVSALELRLTYLGNLNTLLGVNNVNVANPAGTTALPGNAGTLLGDIQLATVNADAGNTVTLRSPETGSPYGVGLLVGFLMLVGALGIGVTYRRFAAVKVRG